VSGSGVLPRPADPTLRRFGDEWDGVTSPAGDSAFLLLFGVVGIWTVRFLGLPNDSRRRVMREGDSVVRPFTMSWRMLGLGDAAFCFGIAEIPSS
jgi:hypothetical protein